MIDNMVFLAGMFYGGFASLFSMSFFLDDTDDRKQLFISSLPLFVIGVVISVVFIP
jgi:hypothetical protein